MGVLLFYLVAVLPVIIGLVQWIKYKEVVWWEWLAGSALCFAVAGIMHMIATTGLTGDTETWSGQIVRAIHYPTWIEEYEESHTRTTTNSDGEEETETYYTTEHRTHWEYWTYQTTLGQEPSISQARFNEIAVNFQSNIETKEIYKCGFDSGDPNIYIANNESGYLYPVTDRRMWSNRVKAAPSVFSFVEVPPSIPVFAYPVNDDIEHSNRLQGAASLVDWLEWDRMNARLGPTKKVNVIMVGFTNGDSNLGQYQEAKWIGGKKNDLVICYGGLNKAPTWVYVFGWTEKTLVKRDLEQIVLEKGALTETIPVIEQEIIANYTIKDWTKFDYLKIEPPFWCYIVYFLFQIITQGVFYYWAHGNEFTQDGVVSRYSRALYYPYRRW